MSAAARIKKRALASYGALAVPVAFAGMPLYVNAPDFYATQYHVPLSVLGFVLLGLRVIDAVQDPLIGLWSDRFARFRLGLMLVCGALLVASVYGLFFPPPFNPLMWFAVWMFLAATSYSVLSINLATLGALWSDQSHEKTRIAASREAFGLVGLLLAVSVPGLLMTHMPAPQAFFYVCGLLALLMLAGLALFARWHQTQTLTAAPTRRPQTLIAILRGLPPATRVFLFAYGLSMLASSIPAVLVMFFIRDLLGSASATGLFLLLYFLSGAACMPVWQRLSERYGKYRAWGMSMLLAAASFVWAFFLEAGDVWQYGLICLTSGMALGADLALPPSILADHIEQRQAGHEASTQFSLLTFIAKAALALASAIALPLISAAGFLPAGDNTPHALFVLSLTYALLPCGIKLCAAGVIWRNRLTSPHGENYETHAHITLSGNSRHA